MGRYLPVIKTAECGSLTRAAHALGYTQPSLGYIINNIENELGVKMFYRNQRGMTLTETGESLLKIMREIEDMESHLMEVARISRWEMLRVGVFPSVASQWVPEILKEFYETYPKVVVKLEHSMNDLAGELSVKEHKLDCCFTSGPCPPGMESFPLYEDPYYLVVSEDHEIAALDQVSMWDLGDELYFVPSRESFDISNTGYEVEQLFDKEKIERLDFQPQENQTTIAMVEKGLGATILPGLTLRGLIEGRKVKVIPLKEELTRTISLLCPRELERSQLTNVFLRIAQRWVTQWKQEETEQSP
ncbi:MAG: LysR family transcriptional regulator [Clostridiales bacterium]|nr:LysR family transcriptional regulator [Clostridiales bacterium]MDY4171210.1 LysR family transcriptional regulator [Evtepia sp.]